jgi:hypothetical protein
MRLAAPTLQKERQRPRGTGGGQFSTCQIFPRDRSELRRAAPRSSVKISRQTSTNSTPRYAHTCGVPIGARAISRRDWCWGRNSADHNRMRTIDPRRNRADTLLPAADAKKAYEETAMHRTANVLRRGTSICAVVVAVPPIMCAPSAFDGSPQSDGRYVSAFGSMQKPESGITVDQNPTSGIIEWQSLSIGRGKTVQVWFSALPRPCVDRKLLHDQPVRA